MKLVLLTNIISPHQIPLAKEVVNNIGENNFTYIYTSATHKDRINMGWAENEQAPWCKYSNINDKILLDTDLLLSGHRVLDVFQKRAKLGKLSLYMSERWFKPPIGMLRLFHPKYFKMAYQTVKMLDCDKFYYLPMGIHAARDMIRLYKLFHGDLTCLFRTPKVAFESKPFGTIIPLKEAIKNNILTFEEIEYAKKYGFVQISPLKEDNILPQGVFSKMKLWGYFVAPKMHKENKIINANRKKKVLWVGRMLEWKNAKTVIDAVINTKNSEIVLNLYGDGPCKKTLMEQAKSYNNIKFHNFVPVEKIRELMREHDIYILASNGYEGWGAVVNEALEEEMNVYSSREAGAGATILPSTNLFKFNNQKQLTKLLLYGHKYNNIFSWSTSVAAKELCNLIWEFI